MGDPVEIGGDGKLATAADASAPLLVVFGGIDVGGVQSGHYMWKYMDVVKNRFHIFVATNNVVNGKHSHDALMKAVKAQSLAPARRSSISSRADTGPGWICSPAAGLRCSRPSSWSTSGWA